MPFTVDQFFEVFAIYNQSVWPAQVLLYLLAFACIPLLFRSGPASSRAISLILALFWTWMGVAYHFAFFSRINPAAWVFGAAFVVEGLIFVWVGLVRRKMRFRIAGGVTGLLGWGFILLGLVIYPVVGFLAGQRYPAFPTFGLPCPTTIFSVAMLLFATRPRPRSVLVVPALWTIIGSYAALRLGVTEDLMLVLAGALAFGMILQKRTAPKELA